MTQATFEVLDDDGSFLFTTDDPGTTGISPEEAAVVSALRVGESMSFEGGAAPMFTIRRVS